MTPRQTAIALLAESEGVERAVALATSVAQKLNPTLGPEALRHLAEGLLHEAINLV